MGVRITKFKADNFKRLVAVEISPDGDVVILSGKNGSGKSSALDAIWAALGGKAACPDKPIREGADKAEVRLELDNGLVVERTFTEKGTYLKVTAEEGRQKFTNPQAMLDALVGKIAFDPLAFARKAPKDQAAELLKVVDIGLDLEEHARQRQALYDARADANREVKRLDGARAVQLHYDDAPAEIISASILAEEVSQAANVEAQVGNAKKRLEEIDKEMAALEAERERMTAVAAGAVPDLPALRERLANVEVDNNKVRANERYAEIMGELKAARAVADKLDADLKGHDAAKEKALAAAKFPVEGLSFDEEGVTYNGIPFAQCASSEQLKVAVAVAMAANPELRVIQIREGSLLDRESLDVIADLAGANDYQVWIEVVSDGDKVGIVIEDGSVVHAPALAERTT
jgi:DNA repair exonuclease SbcCD ATPase subunit